MLYRKDFVAVATMLNSKQKLIPEPMFSDLVVWFATFFKNHNPDFHHARFVEACNKKEISK